LLPIFPTKDLIGKGNSQTIFATVSIATRMTFYFNIEFSFASKKALLHF